MVPEATSSGAADASPAKAIDAQAQAISFIFKSNLIVFSKRKDLYSIKETREVKFRMGCSAQGLKDGDNRLPFYVRLSPGFTGACSPTTPYKPCEAMLGCSRQNDIVESQGLLV
jgi:hypothetical protein